jgi:hypothetical protein
MALSEADYVVVLLLNGRICIAYYFIALLKLFNKTFFTSVMVERPSFVITVSKLTERGGQVLGPLLPRRDGGRHRVHHQRRKACPQKGKSLDCHSGISSKSFEEMQSIPGSHNFYTQKVREAYLRKKFELKSLKYYSSILLYCVTSNLITFRLQI